MTQSPPPVVLVTGAARGIGLATTRQFLTAGWHVAMLDIDTETLNAAVSEIAQPEKTLALSCDVSDPEQVQQSIDKLINHFGHLNSVINNAGVAIFKPIQKTSLKNGLGYWQ